MKKVLYIFAAVMLCVGAFMAFTTVQNSNQTEVIHADNEVSGEGWITWEQAVELQKKEPRKIIVDVYTDWCGWCKKMDASTFVDPKVKKYLGEKYYAVKLDAEQKEDIVFNGETFKLVTPEGARRGVHTLAYALLDGKMSYPTVVYLDENYARIMVSPGFKGVDDMMKELKFAGDNHYQTQDWNSYKTK